MSTSDNPTATATEKNLPTPHVQTTRPPDSEKAARQFLDFWKSFDYEAMYPLLSKEAQNAVSLEKFLQTYQNVSNEATLTDLDYFFTSNQTGPAQSEIGFHTQMKSAILGELEREMKMDLVLEDGQWRVQWKPEMVLPELAGGNRLGLDRQWGGRGAIYDLSGNPLAKQVEAVAIGVWPDYVDLSKSKGLVNLLSMFSPYRADTIYNLIENAYPGDYIPIGEVPADQDPSRLAQLTNWGSVVVSNYSRRLYYDGGIAPHVVGYVSAIQQEEMGAFRRKGYLADDRVGRKGIELSQENVLMGTPGGSVYVFDPDGRPVAELGTGQSQPAKDVYLTIDSTFQEGVQQALSYLTGAIVVLEKDTGRVLAMASSPTFDPNAFEFDNYNWNTQISQITSDNRLPQYNRATQGQYPLGSVFKLVTMAAALESGRFTKDSTYDCQYTFDELPGFTRYDWTWEYFQEDGVTQPSGLLTLPEGLIRSCNPWFWHIGVDLYNAGDYTAISNMSRSFGLGAKTGIDVVEEETGNVPDPGSVVDAINLAIGQGDFLSTPLQVARFIAALGNGGTLLRPQLIEKIVDKNGSVTPIFRKEAQGTLPIKPENLALIQEAMHGVISSRNPPGTAYKVLGDVKINMAGKTGTATSSTATPHAWFAGYTFQNNPNKPDIAIVVIAENAGEGSKIAAPIFRRVVELYFFGNPQKLYPWEASLGVTRSPTSPVTEIPTAQSGLNP